jgi:hypothetical protein
VRTNRAAKSFRIHSKNIARFVSEQGHGYMSLRTQVKGQMEISWTDRVKNEGVLLTVKEEEEILHAIKRGLNGLTISSLETTF